MPEKISIIRDSGETLSSNIVALFTIPDNEKKYIITTENAVDPHGLTVLHVSEIVDGVLKKIATDEEWASIKTIMRSIISGSVGSFQFIPMIKTAKAEAQYSRDISVSAAAAQQIIDSYAASNPEGDGAASAPVEEEPKDVDEITPGISEVVEEEVPEVASEPEQTTEEAEPSVGDAVTNIESSDMVTTPEEETNEEVPVPTVEEVVQEDVKEEVVETPAVEEEVAEASVPVEEVPVQTEVQQINTDVPVQTVNVQTPVVAYVDPAFQQLLTSDYNQILMHVQNINNNINQIAAMPALNYQPSYSANPNGAPNFNPNATVDEIIMGSTEVFNEGVKNLVATITEKLYRDLYQREAELAKREEILLEREKMVNEQLAKLGNSVPVPVEAAPATVEVAPVESAPVENEVAQETPEVNVVDASVKIEETVPAQQNTAPVAEPVAEKVEEPKKEEVVEAAVPVNNVPQPVQTVEIV